MSERSQVRVVRIQEIQSHPNADRLEIIPLDGYNVVVQKDLWKVGDLAAYVPEDFVVPQTDLFAFLGEKRIIKAQKLRGILSVGILVKAPENSNEGDDVTVLLGCEKYEPIPTQKLTGGQPISIPFVDVKFTDIENVRKYHRLLEPDEPVVITEKIHGSLLRVRFYDNQLFVGSKNEWKEEGSNAYWNAVNKYQLLQKLENFPNYIFYGEVYGWVQDLRYGHMPGQVDLTLFDVYDTLNWRWCDYSTLVELASQLEVPTVPLLYRGNWQGLQHHASLGSGESLLGGNIKEGFVVRPEIERWNEEIGRLILKYHSDDYLLRKKGRNAGTV